MQSITGTVGTGGANGTSDVALVQAILVKIQRAAATGRAAAPYLPSYDGSAGPATLAAILAFQTDHALVAATGIAANPRVTSGLVAAGDATWAKLLEQVPAEFSDMRVLAGGKTVYVAATAAQLQAKLTAAGALTFTSAFLLRVNATINRMHSEHGIAIGVCPQGDRRTFQAQYDLFTSGRNVTNAGPGESNHNFGMAVDLGFQGLRWLRSNGAVVTNETYWLHQLDGVSAAESQRFWDALRTAGIDIGAFRGPATDRPHLQNWNDAGVSMAVRLGDLLTRSGTMRWEGRGRQPYRSDLGLGGEMIAVGTAAQIWNRQATVSLPDLQRLRTAAAARRPAVPSARNAPPARPGAAAAPAAPPVTQDDIVAMRQALRHQFELADANWRNWTPR
ncbi:hypothetical protein [Sphingomonas alpina]|uniref:M15 family metallopeptidase n=1 Tax=Sphingomonas alpina TaxID=653931 RepID=A0A7H0LKP7_9SPHN|nr:hypothetical protein [Sphingomonas alpina]QNQ10250.1 hypothetical protein H3Z74_03145 [Sphingomonas alpina]